jgi:hypothetical protein
MVLLFRVIFSVAFGTLMGAFFAGLVFYVLRGESILPASIKPVIGISVLVGLIFTISSWKSTDGKL